jgi:DNA damage-inducible protein 1
MSEITVTIVNPQTEQSETLPVATTMTVAELADLSMALFGFDSQDIRLVKDGSPLTHSSTMSAAGVVHGDLLVVMVARSAPPPRPAPAAAGGLDFSNLLGASAPMPAAPNDNGENLVYYPGMNLDEAIHSRPHPKAIIKLLQEHPNLFKELNYHDPIMASKLKDQPLETAVNIWREEKVKNGIKHAFAISQHYHKQQSYQKRLQANPDDTEAKEYFAKQKRLREVHEQYMQAMEEYPESMGRVLMLYVNATINDTKLQAFVDSGAQSTIMSKKCAERCGVLDLVDTRFEGMAVGVGTGKILGRIHIVQLKIGDYHFPCSVTVMDDATLPAGGTGDDPKPKDMDFLLGLDMLKRHTCSIDLETGNLKFRIAPGQYLQTPFLHEHELDESKGGTKGYDPEKDNQRMLEAMQKRNEKKGNGNDDDEEDAMVS